MVIQLAKLHLHFRELLPNGKAELASPPEGAVLPVDCTTLGIQGWGEGTSTEASVTGGMEISPSRQSRSSAEEGVLALEEAEQPAVWDRLLDDLLDLYREEGGQAVSRVPISKAYLRDISPSSSPFPS